MTAETGEDVAVNANARRTKGGTQVEFRFKTKDGRLHILRKVRPAKYALIKEAERGNVRVDPKDKGSRRPRDVP